MVDHFFKVLTSLRNCNLASSPALRLGGAAEQLSGLCFQKRPTPSGTMILTALCAIETMHVRRPHGKKGRGVKNCPTWRTNTTD